jgi:glycosyltransferase involved in cell wall biosynthesis
MTRVSVVMPVYNGERFLRESIESILGQTYIDFEFIIINDGSTDGSARIIESYLDSRIRYTENSENIGVTRSLNRGLALAAGEYVARMDADDISLPNRFATQVSFLDSHPEVGVLGTGVRLIDEFGRERETLVFPSEHGVLRWMMCFLFNPIPHPSVMIRRRHLEQVGGYKEEFMCSQDYDLWWRMGEVSGLSNLQELLLSLRKHSENISSTHSNMQREVGLRINRQILTEVLQEEVPFSVVERLSGGCFASDVEILETVNLICRLARMTIGREGLSSGEKRKIRGDAADRMLALLERSGLSRRLL